MNRNLILDNMTNKELKVGSKIWLYSIGLDEDDCYIVKSVKKDKTLISVVVEAKYFNEEVYEMKMYGHASSSILSGFDRKFRYSDLCYTCDYSLVEKKTRIHKGEMKYREAGYDFLRLVKYFKQ